MGNLAAVQPDLILLDVMRPGVDGVELLSRMKAYDKFRDIPVIMATVKGTEYDKVDGDLIDYCLRTGRLYSYRAPDGKRHRTCKRGFRLQRDATKWQREELLKLIQKMEQEQTLDENLTMEELITEYIEYTKARRRASTVENKVNIIKSKICPYFNTMRVYAVSKNDIRKWQDQLLALRNPNGEPFPSAYLRSINNQLLAILNYAVIYHNLPINPVVQIERIGTKRPEEEREF